MYTEHCRRQWCTGGNGCMYVHWTRNFRANQEQAHNNCANPKKCANTETFPIFDILRWTWDLDFIQGLKTGNWVENLSPAMGRGIDSRNRVWNWIAKLHKLASRYDKTKPTWFLAPIAGLNYRHWMADHLPLRRRWDRTRQTCGSSWAGTSPPEGSRAWTGFPHPPER